MVHNIFLGMEEVLGREAFHKVLGSANLPELIDQYPPKDLELNFPYQIISLILSATEDIYGTDSAHGIALRVGSACFKHELRVFGQSMGITDLEFRLLPLRRKLSAGVASLANLYNQNTDQRIRVQEEEDCLMLHITRCPFCWDLQSDSPCCHFFIGVLREALYWISGGKWFHVQETCCIAAGDETCTFSIPYHSLD
jgi:predicted hydrocarbon binding protein